MKRSHAQNFILPVLTTILLLIPLLLHGQERGAITGHVKDAKTQQALIGVNVVLLDTQRGATTDTLGNFRIANVPPGSYRLRFSYIGYENFFKTDVVVNSARPAIANVSLVPTAILGQAVTVTAGYFVESELAPVSTSALAREEIRRFPGGFEDVVRTAATLPGVAVINDGGRNDLLVRGGGPSENLYLVNGLEVPNINHFGSQGLSSGALSFVNLDFVDDIEFSTGGFSAKFGDKMSSVLSVNMRPGRSDRVGGKATISATQFGLNLEGPVTPKGSFLFSARRSYLDILFKALGLPFVPVYTDFNFFGTYNFSATDELTVMALAAVDRVDRDQSSLENRVTNAGILGNSQDQFITGAKYRKIFGKGFVDWSLGLNRIDFRFSQIDSLEREYFRSNATETELNFKVDGFTQLSKRTGFSTGVVLKRLLNDNTTAFADTIFDRNGREVPLSSIDLPNTILADTAVTKAGAYLQLEQQVGQRLEVNFGVRADYFDFLDKAFYPAIRSSAQLQLSDAVQLSASYGRYYQSPAYVWVSNPVNRGLKALKNDMIITGLSARLRDDVNLKLESYYKRYRDLPTGATAGTDYLVLTNTGVGYGGREDNYQSFGYFPLVSDGSGRSYGFELLLQKKYSDTPLYGQVSLALNKSEYTAANGRTYPGQYDQRLIFNISGGYKFSTKWEISAKLRYFTGAPYTPVYLPELNRGLIQNLPQEYLADRLPAGHLLDIRVDRRFNFRTWSLIVFTDVQNAYNNKLYNRPRYDFWEQKILDRDELGILPSIGISAEF
ncbi:MAG: TonB-dependent receptor [Deferribacteres bacterium]|nr:TonB-dependent receptor [Deferribacteres bacterium]